MRYIINYNSNENQNDTDNNLKTYFEKPAGKVLASTTPMQVSPCYTKSMQVFLSFCIIVVFINTPQ